MSRADMGALCDAGKEAGNLDLSKLMVKRQHIIASTLRSRTDAFKAKLIRDLQVMPALEDLLRALQLPCVTPGTMNRGDTP